MAGFGMRDELNLGITIKITLISLRQDKTDYTTALIGLFEVVIFSSTAFHPQHR